MAKSKNIVLLHGWGASVEKFRPLADELERLNWQDFIPKLPGFDEKAPKKAWGVEEYADDTLNRSDKYFKGGKYLLFGHSFGGRMAVRAAIKKPDRLYGIVLCNTSGLSRGNPLKRIVFFVLAKTGKLLLLIPPIAKLWRKLLYKLAGEHDYETTEGIMRDVFKKVVSEDLRPLIRNIKIPTLILWGKQDRMTPISDAYYIKKFLPDAKLVVFEDEGHRLPYNRPKEVAKEIDKWAVNLH